MRAVNLLPRDERKSWKTQTSPPVIGAVIAFVGVTALLAATFLTVSGNVARNQNRLEAVQAELAATPVPAPASAGSTQLEEQKSNRVAALSTALGGRVAWDRVLREVSLVLPDDVWLSSLSAQAPTAVAVAAAGAPASGFTINGNTYSHDGVARLLARLALVPELSNVQLQHSTLSTSESGRKIVEFTINATLKAPGATS